MNYRRARRALVGLAATAVAFSSAESVTAAAPATIAVTGATTASTASRAVKSASSPYVGENSATSTLTRAVAADLDDYWSVRFPLVFGAPYKPLAGGFLAATPNRIPPVCGATVPTYDDVKDNAFYCRPADYVTWDEPGLAAQLETAFGDAAVAIALAHEMGHAIQARTAIQLPGLLNELQADCFAGSWLRRVSDGGSPKLKFEPAALDNGIASMLAFRDSPGTASSASGAHGNGFDRIGAFQTGWQEGVRRCASFNSKPPLITADRFRPTDAPTGGNLAFDDAFRFAVTSTTAHYRQLGVAVKFTLIDSAAAKESARKTCTDAVVVTGAVVIACPKSANVLIDAEGLRSVYRSVKDAGSSYLVAMGAAALFQRQRQPKVTETRAFTVALNCLTGKWLAAVAKDPTATLSPGDLDETIMAAAGVPASRVLNVTSRVGLFDRVTALRKGFETPTATC